MEKKHYKTMAVCGYKAVKALVNMHPENVTRFYFNKERSISNEFKPFLKYLAEKKVPYNVVENSELEKLSKSLHHQGVVAFINEPKLEKLSKEKISEFIEKKEQLLFLDIVGNTNNLGAIIRSAAFFGIKHIIIPEDTNQASIATSTYRVAQGGMEYVTLYTVQSTERFLRDIAGKIVRIGTDLAAKQSVSQLSNICMIKDKDKNGKKDREKKPCVIILGNEEHGISPQIKRLCDELIKIPGNNTIQSLNVAQAASIILWELIKKARPN